MAGKGWAAARALQKGMRHLAALFATAVWSTAFHAAAVHVTAAVMILTCASQPSGAAEPGAMLLPAPPRDLRAAAADAARQGRALLVLFSEEGCPYCARLRRDFLLPMQRNEGYRSKLVFFEVDIHSPATLTDFDGHPVTQMALARRYAVRLLPTVMLLGPGGARLAPPLVGYNGPDFYGAYLDERIETALKGVAPSVSGGETR
jgi:thioredoxin-related protein